MVYFKNPEGYADPTAYQALLSAERKEKPRRYRPLVYVCSPYAGDVERNVSAAKRYSRFVYENDRIPVTPHLLYPQFINDKNPVEWDDALWMGCILMSKCREVWVFGSAISSGMDHEISIARRRRQNIRYFTTDCVEVTT